MNHGVGMTATFCRPLPSDVAPPSNRFDSGINVEVFHLLIIELSFGILHQPVAPEDVVRSTFNPGKDRVPCDK